MARKFPDDIRRELSEAGKRDEIEKVSEESRRFMDRGRAAKKNYAERLSKALAQKVADALRPRFKGILPDEQGARHESRARTAKGVKKLDVNYSTPELGLGLGISIKTINFPDPGTGRYTKNYTRVDNELRAEAADYHGRQPYAVLAALIFLPGDATKDGKTGPSSFKQAWNIFRYRAGRNSTSDDATLFESVYLGLYETEPDEMGNIAFINFSEVPPDRGRPNGTLNFSEVLEEIAATFNRRNQT